MMVVSPGPSAGGNVWMAPLISMVAERSGRRVLRTRRIDWPVRFCTVREMASAVNTMVRCASMASRVRANMGLAARSVLDIRKDCSSPGGDILWVFGTLPGSVHDKKAEWIWGVLAELEAADLVTLADKGYQGSAHAKIPYRGKNKPESQKQANRAHAKLAHPASARTPSSRPGESSASSAAAPGAPGSSPRPSTYCRSARHNQGGRRSVTQQWLPGWLANRPNHRDDLSDEPRAVRGGQRALRVARAR